MEIDYSLFIDLGGIYPVSLAINDNDYIKKPDSEKILLGYGASGEINGYKDQIEQITIGDYVLSNIPSVFIEVIEKGDHTNTTIGLPALLRFNHINEALYIEPNSRFNEPYSD